jgi:hypothetical protein
MLNDIPSTTLLNPTRQNVLSPIKISPIFAGHPVEKKVKKKVIIKPLLKADEL